MLSEILHYVAVVRTDVSEEHIASIFRVIGFCLPSSQRGYTLRRPWKRTTCTTVKTSKKTSLFGPAWEIRGGIWLKRNYVWGYGENELNNAALSESVLDVVM
jgi:hypothetical protein